MPHEASSADGQPGAGRPRRTPKKAKRSMPLWQESLLLMGLAVVLALVVKTFLVQAFYIPSGSMEPGLEINDRILVQKVSYWGDGGPERGDVVVFEDPGSWLSPRESAGPTGPVASTLSKIGLYPTGGHLVKRVIGVAGDTITCCDEQGRLLVNGEPLDSSSFIRNDRDCDGPMIASCDWSAGPVPEGSVFVMGDHRDDSADSSFHLRCDTTGRGKNAPDAAEETCDGTEAWVGTDLVVGKVFARVWPASRFSLLDTPGAFDTLD
ncbi:Signal peptidase I [Nocardioides dokdonensis FR1436]|uniref:Signal peptidase I n=1 Tax=Nocardioides dokdonensis FR1436 TaxID=1300347 RepID=A0A1A9GQ17_9ACTN|nr:signal peptidase I [Nocardioides dokdonensis]ANH40378.1 Signal peptidase I [Nocardioides dokdonensis FR1436]